MLKHNIEFIVDQALTLKIYNLLNLYSVMSRLCLGYSDCDYSVIMYNDLILYITCS